MNALTNVRRWLSVSTVPPDLLDTTMTVFDRSPASARPTTLGSVESRTTSSTPAVRVITSGASDEPPMPDRTTRSRPSDRKSACRASISASSGRDVSCRSTQPSRIEASCSASGPQIVASLAAIRDAIFSATSLSTTSVQSPFCVLTVGTLTWRPP